MDGRAYGTAAASATAGVPLTALMPRVHVPGGGRPREGTGGYGPLAPVADGTTGLPLLMLPEGFRYRSLGWAGDPLASGRPTPGLHAGMAAFRARGHHVRLVRNHERAMGTPFSAACYDGAAAGGTTTLEFDTRAGVLVGASDSLSGTIRTCAGGATPWRSWLTAERTTQFTRVPHGYVFEVPASGPGSPLPIRGMGRFSHAAVALDPLTGCVYETEDAGANSGLYRYVPYTRGQLAGGGELYMLKVAGADLANLGAGHASGTTFDVEWVRIDRPDSLASSMPGNFVWSQGRAQGGATFARLAGCCAGNGREIHVVSTTGGAGHGQVWVYDPQDETITLRFQSPGPSVLHAPADIAASPRGGLVLCGQRHGVECLHGLTADGQIFPLATNQMVLNGERHGIVGDFRGAGWAGACFSPDGDWLFANIGSPGVTFAITGPWREGVL